MKVILTLYFRPYLLFSILNFLVLCWRVSLSLSLSLTYSCVRDFLCECICTCKLDSLLLLFSVSLYAPPIFLFFYFLYEWLCFFNIPLGLNQISISLFRFSFCYEEIPKIHLRVLVALLSQQILQQTHTEIKK